MLKINEGFVLFISLIAFGVHEPNAEIRVSTSINDIKSMKIWKSA